MINSRKKLKDEVNQRSYKIIEISIFNAQINQIELNLII